MNTISNKITLLVAEDDKFNRLLVVSMLGKSEHFEVLEAKDGEEALQMLVTHNIDLLLLDLHMPKVNGFETLKEIRNIDKVVNMPIMIISSDETEKKRSLELGASSFIPKPFKLKTLEDEIYNILGATYS